MLSHHLDSPEARQDPRLDISDVYLFRGDTGTVFVMNVNPLSGSGGFHPEALYEFKVDTDGDAVEDLTFRVTFGAAYPTGQQRVELHHLEGPAARDRDAEGRIVTHGVTGEECPGTGGVRLWAGPAADPFFIEGAVIGAVCTAVANGAPVDLSGFEPAKATNIFAGTNVCGIVLEVPDAVLGGQQIGFWGVTALPTDSGGWRQINRCAQPLINTILHPADSGLANEYNANEPSEDLRRHGPRLIELISGVVAAMGTAADPSAYAERVRDALFPDILRYQVGTAANFSFAERNGRGLVERSPEVICSMVLNTAVAHGLGSGSASGTPRAVFPYLPPPVPVSSSS
jgi:hypothetical protein